MAFNNGPSKVEEIGIVQNGLVCWVHASALSSYGGSGTTWSDIKNSNGLTMLSNVTFDTTYNPVTAKSMNFAGSGSTNKLTCSFTITSGTVWSQQCFFKPSNQESGGYGYFNRDWCAISEGGTANGATKKLYLYIDNATAQAISTTQFETDTWYNLGWVFHDDGTVKVYVNGVLDKTTTVSWVGDNYPQKTFTGLGAYSTSNHPLNGKLGNFMIYNRELTASEFLKNFTTERSRFGI